MGKIYILSIKSHSLEPDYEREVTANNRKEALDILEKDDVLHNFGRDLLNKNLGEIK